MAACGQAPSVSSTVETSYGTGTLVPFKETGGYPAAQDLYMETSPYDTNVLTVDHHNYIAISCLYVICYRSQTHI